MSDKKKIIPTLICKMQDSLVPFFLQCQKLNWAKSEQEEQNRYSRSPVYHANKRWGQEEA